MKQKHLFWGAAVALTFLFSASAVAQPRHTKKKVKKVVEAKVDVCPFTDKWVEDETKFEDRKEKAHATFVPYSSTASMQQDDYYKFPWLTPKHANYLLLNGKWKFHYTADWKQGKPEKDNFWADNADVSPGKELQVPLNWGWLDTMCLYIIMWAILSRTNRHSSQPSRITSTRIR